MKYFVTGGSGFLGINLIRFLLDKGHEIVSIDLLPFDYPEKDKIYLQYLYYFLLFRF